MRVVVAPDTDGAACEAADIVERFVTQSRPASLGLATGVTMEALFAELARRHREQGLSFAHVDAYLLDEYVGLDPCDPNAFRMVAHRLLARGVEPSCRRAARPEPPCRRP